jgi:hypothetical protein
MMVYNTRNYWVSGLCPSSGILDASFKRLDLFLSSGGGGGGTYSVGSLGKS